MHCTDYLKKAPKQHTEALLVTQKLGFNSYNLADPRGIDQVYPIFCYLTEENFQKVQEITSTHRSIFATAITKLCANNLFNEDNLIRLLNVNADDMAQEAKNIINEYNNRPCKS